jgi:hypothetical protein
MPDVDDGSIADDHNLLRRVRPDQIVDDENLGIRRPSSAVFKQQELSADSEHILSQRGSDWQFSLQGYAGYSLARFRAGTARQLGLAVIHKPLQNNDAHVEVHGKKTGSIADTLVTASWWAHLEPKK